VSSARGFGGVSLVRDASTARAIAVLVSDCTIPRIRARVRWKRCYELTCRGLLIDDCDERWRVVHGEITDVNGMTFPHAWLAAGELIYDAVLDEAFLRDEFTMVYSPIEYASFDRRQAAHAASKFGTYGPWAGPECEVVPHRALRAHLARTAR